MKIPISNLEKEGIYQASKWIQISAFLDPEEMKHLFEELGGSLHPLGKMISIADSEISLKDFLSVYAGWIYNLQKGFPPEEKDLKKVLACAWTRSIDTLYIQEIREGRFLLRIKEPVVQINAHFFRYSSLDQKFRSKTFGQDSIFWGLEFSYPFLIQNGKRQQIQVVSTNFDNTHLFFSLRRWIRNHTRATSFFVDGRKVFVPMRIGKGVGTWIRQHPSLKEQNLEVSL